MQETIRNKIMLHMLGFAVAMLLLAWVVSTWSLGEQGKIITDLGLTITVLIGVVIALFAGIVLVWNEVEHHTILTTLAKPIARWEYIVGKYLGFSTAVIAVYYGMSLLLIIFLIFFGIYPTWELAAAIYLSSWEVLIIAAVAIMFSAFASPSYSALFSISLFIVGRFSWDIRVFIEHNPRTLLRPVLEIVYAVIPHLSYFNKRYAAVHDINIEWNQVVFPTFYGVVYCVLVLIIAVIAFKNRDLV